jgi:hypothetical protein
MVTRCHLEIRVFYSSRKGAVLEVFYHYSTVSFFLLTKRFVLCSRELVVILITSSELDGSIKKVRRSMGDKNLSAIDTTNSN